MNNIEKLYKISKKKEKLIIGLMSGTSLDGLDIALCLINGNGTKTKVKIENFETINYKSDLKKAIRNISSDQVDLQELCMWNAKLGQFYGQLINDALKKWKVSNDSIDLIASHGQTIFHCPASLHKSKMFGNSTLQIGDGDHIAQQTKIITVSDFRHKNIAAGGEGAPLAVYGDFILFAKEKENVLLLNIGGIANLTFIPKNKKNIICTDTGPGNILMDAWMRKKFNKAFDKNGSVAASGKVNKKLLANLYREKFFKKEVPKSTGNEVFNLDYILKSLENISKINDEDIITTLNYLTFQSIADIISKLPSSMKILVSGGGSYNLHLMQNLRKRFTTASFTDIENYGISADAKEAVLFAILANECVSGNFTVFNDTNILKTTMGKISLPN